MRDIKDAKDLDSGNLIYFKSHAGATYLSDGTTVEDAILNLLKQDGTSSTPSAGVGLTDLSTKLDKNMYYTNVPASTWVTDNTYENYKYRCDVLCTGVTSSNFALVVFGLTEVLSGKYAPICETKENIVSIWSTTNIAIIIPTIVIYK